jgi:hypothetical protein
MPEASSQCVDLEILMYCFLDFFTLKIYKYMHHRTIQINQPTRCENSSSLLLDVYVQLNMFRESLRPSSGAQLQ